MKDPVVAVGVADGFATMELTFVIPATVGVAEGFATSPRIGDVTGVGDGPDGLCAYPGDGFAGRTVVIVTAARAMAMMADRREN